MTTAGYTVACIEKGPYRNFTDWDMTKYDEWMVLNFRKFDHPLSLWSFSLRNNPDQYANPIRRYTGVQTGGTMGHGVGGASQHWAGGLGRISPWAYKPYTNTVQKYGSSVLPSNHDLIDWPFEYSDVVAYMEEWEQEGGVSGDNQDPFTPGAKYPLPPHPPTPLAELFRDTTESMGYHPRAAVSGIASQPYVNQFGVQVNSCVYCGWCGGPCNYHCQVGAKFTSAFRSIPAALKTGKLDLRVNSIVYRIDLDGTGKKATGVRYYDERGNVNVQPAKAVFNAAYSINVVRLLLLSGIGTPYDHATKTGSVGRGLTETSAPSATSASGTIDMGGNRYPAGNASGGGYTIEDFADDNFNHNGLNFIGGANISVGGYLGSAPGQLTLTSAGPNNFGSAYKATLIDAMLPTKRQVTIRPSGPAIPTSDSFEDLDPHYVDAFGDPILRITDDFSTNENPAADYIAPLASNILTKMGFTDVKVNPVSLGNQHKDRQSAHIRGGARLGANPDNSVFNKWMQSWDVENLFAAGECLVPFGDNTSQGTHALGFQSYIAADGIKKYLQSPGPLA
jgi:gluconate 2-dehydrogenase alpha chain